MGHKIILSKIYGKCCWEGTLSEVPFITTHDYVVESEFDNFII
jgi:hypothetical protein